MSRSFIGYSDSNYVVMHTYGISIESDVSFQKGAWSMQRREQNLENAYLFCEEAGMNARDNLAVIGFNQKDNSCRLIDGPDEDVLTKKDGNVLITSGKTVLMGWAADCCLVGFVVNDGKYVAVAHASVNTLKNGIIKTAVSEIIKLAGTDCKIDAFVGACAGGCCYEYGKEKAFVDFSKYQHCIYSTNDPEKVTLDLHAAVVSALDDAGVDNITDLFSENENCTICSKNKDGEYMFPSYRRDVDEDGNHVNGQYGLFIAIK